MGPKVTVKANVPKVTTPKISGKVTAGTKAGAKATVKDATVDLTGSCPQAKWMGLTTVATVASKGLTICKDMKSTCCDAASMTSYKTKFDAYTKRVSAMMWSMGKLPLMNVAALAELSDKMNMPSKTPVAPAATDKKRRLQSLTAKAAAKAPKASVKVTVPKVAVKAAVKVPKVKVTVPKVSVPKVSVKAGVKSAVTVPKVAVKAGVKSAVTAPKLSGKITTPKVKLTTPKVAVKKTVKVSLKLTAPAKPKPSMWNMSADGKTKNANQAQWAAAWNAANKLANKRGSVQSYGLKCFTSALTLRAH